MNRLFFTLCALAILACLAPCAHAAERPNILLILADDLGYGDLRCYNPESRIPTPHLNRLAEEGMRFTDAHTPSAVCTPTRYGLLTGRYCWRTWLKARVLDGFDPPLIEPEQPTLATFLRGQGYATDCIGKWHLGLSWTRTDGGTMIWRGPDAGGFRGGEEVDFTKELTGGPVDVGFDSWFGISGSLDMPPYCFIENRRVTPLPTERMPEVRELFVSATEGARSPGFTLEGTMPELARRATAYIESRAGKPEPFFLYLPLTLPHLPVVPNESWQGTSGIGTYGDFVAELDSYVGQWLAALEQAKLADNTLVLVTSDNGGLWHTWQPQERDDVAGYKPTPRGSYNAEHGHHSNAELRGTKADIWEGGHRVPFLVRWPGHVQPGSTSAALVELNDVFATVADITATPLPAHAAPDSISFLPALLGTDQDENRRTFAVHHSLHGVFSLREGPWKYVPTRGSGGFSQPRTVKTKPGETEAQLYRLDTDPSETKNVAAEHPEVVERMSRQLTEIQAAAQTRTLNVE